MRKRLHLGWTDIPVTRISIKNAIKGQADENLVRKDFTPSEAVAVWEAMEKIPPGPKEILSDSDSNYRRERASKLVGLSAKSLSEAKQVVNSGDKTLIEEMDRTDNISAI